MLELGLMIKKLLEENIKDVKIFFQEPFKETSETIIYITLDESRIDEKTLPRKDVEKKDVIEKFSGNGVKKIFKLSSPPLKPITRVEHPPGVILRENIDFTVNYEKQTILFKRPPKKGNENIVITYYDRNKVYEILYLTMSVVYRIHIYSKDPEKCNNLTVKILEIIFLNREKLELNNSILNIAGFKTERKNGRIHRIIEIVFEEYNMAFRKKVGVMEEIKIKL